jgi:hypothetical protein
VPTALGDQVKVLDFGISKLTDSNTVQTTEAVLIGTPLYMSPEQALGQNKDITAQSDLFALGSISYELLTGQAPFFADSVAKVVFRIAYEKHAPLSVVRADLPGSVVDAVEHALQKERERRTPSIEAFVLELTGKALAEVSDERGGVQFPGTPITDSMASGETKASTGSRATPAAADYAPSPALSAPTVSGRRVMGVMVVLAVSLAAFLAKVRTDNWAERAVYRAGMVDAGWVMLEDGNFIKPDAGVLTAVVAPTVLDAGANRVETPDAAVESTAVEVPTADAGTAPPVRAEVPPTPDEQAKLDALEVLAARGEWESVWDAGGSLRASLKTPSALRRALERVLEAACARSDNPQIMPVYNELRAVSSASQLKAAKKRCIERYPAAETLW